MDTGKRRDELAGRIGELWDPDSQYASCERNNLSLEIHITKCEFYILYFCMSCISLTACNLRIKQNKMWIKQKAVK